MKAKSSHETWVRRKGTPGNRKPDSRAFGLRRGMLIAALFSSIQNVLQLVLPLYSMQVFDRVLPTENLATLAALSMATGLLIICSVLLDGSRAALLARMASRVDFALHSPAAERALQLGSNDMVPIRDADLIRTFLTSPLATALLDAPWSAAFFVALFLLHPELGALTIIAALVIVGTALSGYFLTKDLRIKAARTLKESQCVLDSCFSSQDVVHSMGLRARLIRKMQAFREQLVLTSQVTNDRQSWIDASSRGFRAAAQVAIIALAAILVIRHDVQAGVIVAASMLFGRAMAPVERVCGGIQGILGFGEAWRRTSRLMRTQPQGRPHLALVPSGGILSVEDLSFAVPERRHPIIASCCFTVAAGSVLAVVGSEGAGKSTLARLLVGALKPTTGTIRLNGSNIEHLEQMSLGDKIGFLPEGAQLGRGTLAEIIARGDVPDPDKMVRAATLVGAHPMIQQLTDGYQTYVGDGSCFLSAGEKQRIALARAFYGLPHVVVLDRPTVNLDDDSISKFIDAVLFLKRQGSSVIVLDRHPGITHIADSLIMLEAGRIILQSDQARIRSVLASALASSPFSGKGAGTPSLAKAQ